MRDEIKNSLKKETKELSEIVFLASESFKIVEFLSKSEEDDDRNYVKNINGFFGYSIITHWRVIVLELAKLFSISKNDHYNLSGFINKLKVGGEYEEAGISQEEICKWLSILEENEIAFQNLKAQRDKLYAHTDKDRKSVKNIITLEKTKELINVTQSIIREIHFVVFEQSFLFDPINAPVENLKWIVDSLTEQKKAREKSWKKLAINNDILDEFK